MVDSENDPWLKSAVKTWISAVDWPKSGQNPMCEDGLKLHLLSEYTCLAHTVQFQ